MKKQVKKEEYFVQALPASKEEYWFNEYLLELKAAGYIERIDFQPVPFVLTEKVPKKFFKLKKSKKGKNIVFSKKQNLINEHSYTPDFYVSWTEKADGLLEQDADKTELNNEIPFLSCSYNALNTYFEVKGGFDNQNMTRMFSNHIQPLVYYKYSEYVNLVKIPDIFKNTFIPRTILNEFFYKRKTGTSQVGDKKFKWEYRSLTEYIELLKEKL